MKLTGLFVQRPHSDIFRTEFHSERSINSDMTGINLFTPLSKVRHCDDLHKTHAWSTYFCKELTYRSTKFHENPTNGLVPDTRWQANEKTDGHGVHTTLRKERQTVQGNLHLRHILWRYGSVRPRTTLPPRIVRHQNKVK